MKQSISYEAQDRFMDGKMSLKKDSLRYGLCWHSKTAQSIRQRLKVFINQSTNGLLSADDQSTYRALRRYVSADLVSFAMKPSKSGPDLKVYSLTDVGLRVLDKFVKRNITGSLLKPNIIRLLEGAK
jgi:DNA-binding PadR family transcriptional regulator